MKIKPTPMCNTCGEIETLLHLYWSCRTTVGKGDTEHLPNHDPEKCLLGKGTNIYAKNTNMLLNILFLLTKSYITKGNA